jgi:hypothetical protein
MVFEVSPAAKETLPPGSTPPTKSAVLAEFAPLPVTAQEADEVPGVWTVV